MKQSRAAAYRLLGLLGVAACPAACGLSAEGTAPDGVGVPERDATAGGDSAAGHGDAGASASDARNDEGLPGDDSTFDGTLFADAPLDRADGGGEGSFGAPESSTGDASDVADADSGAEASDASESADGDAATTGDARAEGGGGDAGSTDGSVDAGGPTDAGVDHPDGPSDGGFSGGDATTDGGSCNFNGTWASRLTIDVTWAPQGLTGIILASGSGQIKQWIKGVRTQTGTSASDATVVCGVSLPDFQETVIAGGETYGVRFPDSLFDKADGGNLPTFTVSGALSGVTPGSTYSTTTTAALLGVSMAHPTTDAWPSTVTTEIDMDNDGKPGVTVGTAQGSPYSDVPTGIPGLFQQPARANRLYVAIRQVTIVNGTVQDCDRMSGTVSIPQIQSKYAIDSHVMGCALADGGDCSTTGSGVGGTSQAAFVDNTQPVFTPSGTTDFHSMRVATGATCADVRAALP